MMIIIEAKALKVGMNLPEADGFLWEVKNVEHVGNKVVAMVASEFSSHRSHRDGVKLVFKASDLIYIAK